MLIKELFTHGLWGGDFYPNTNNEYIVIAHFNLGFPGGSVGKESACSAGDLGSIPGLGRSPGEEHGNPLQYSCLENPHGQRSLAGCSPWGHKESDMPEWLSIARCSLNLCYLTADLLQTSGESYYDSVYHTTWILKEVIEITNVFKPIWIHIFVPGCLAVCCLALQPFSLLGEIALS